MTVTTAPVTYILGEEFELDELRDIVNHGMSAGFRSFIYSSDLHDHWVNSKQEITEYLDEYCEDNFGQSMYAYIAEQLSFDDAHWTEQELIEYAVWMYVECRAYVNLCMHDDNY